MSRLHFQFGCGSHKLAGVLDTAPGETGLLWVSGGNELRSGAFAGQAQLAARLAAKGFPVFRFDRRGIGDSEGDNRGFTRSARVRTEPRLPHKYKFLSFLHDRNNECTFHMARSPYCFALAFRLGLVEI